MPKKIELILISLILLLASILRLWNLGNNPVHLTPDEASLGYNAYSILKTGRDEYGKWFPAIFKSFGDYKPGLYIYTAIPVVAVLGLTEFAVRLPSALAGIASVYLIYLLMNQILSEKTISSEKKNINLGLVAGFILAISPWHIHFSRGAWEANLSLTLTLAGICLFIKSFEIKKYLYFSVVFFALTLFTYQGAKLSTTLVLISLVISFYQWVIQKKIKIIKPVLLLFLLATPILFSLKYGSGRLKVFSLFSYKRSQDQIQSILTQDSKTEFYLFHSEPLEMIKGVALRYFNYLSPRFLFFEGDFSNPLSRTTYHGNMYLLELPLFIIGIASIIRKPSKFKIFGLIWLLLSPLPGALSRDSVNAIRALNMIAPLVVISVIGVSEIIYLKNQKKTKFILLPIMTIYLLSLIRYIDLELIHGPFFSAKAYSYGHKQLVETITPIQSKYKQVLVNQSYSQPYIYFLFFQKTPPQKWWPQAKLTENAQGDVGLIESFDNITFRPLAWSGDKKQPDTLIAGDPLSMAPDAINDTDVNLIKNITLPDGNSAFYVFETLY